MTGQQVAAQSSDGCPVMHTGGSENKEPKFDMQEEFQDDPQAFM